METSTNIHVNVQLNIPDQLHNNLISAVSYNNSRKLKTATEEVKHFSFSLRVIKVKSFTWKWNKNLSSTEFSFYSVLLYCKSDITREACLDTEVGGVKAWPVAALFPSNMLLWEQMCGIGIWKKKGYKVYVRLGRHELDIKMLKCVLLDC